MRKLILTAMAASSMLVSVANADGATTFLADFSNFSFFNGCSGENVLTEPGSYLHGVLRVEIDGGVHLLNQAAGQVYARGVLSGEQYVVHMVNEAIPLANLPTGVNVVDGNGAITIVNRLNIVQPSNPIGVFVADVLLVLTQQDGVNVVRVFSMTGSCHSS